MKEEYVTYEQSQALKRLGFAEPCDTFYNSHLQLCRYSDSDVINRNTNGHHTPSCSAPRLDQAQKWLREVKKWIIYIVPEYDRIRHQCLWAVKHHPFTIASGLTELYTTYELALSAGIDAALELLTDKLNDK